MTPFQFFLARILKLLDEFIKTDTKLKLDEHIQTSKEVIEQFEQVKMDFAQSQQAKAEDEGGVKPEERSVLNYLFVRIRFILSRFGRLISVYEALALQYKEENKEESLYLKPIPSPY